MVAEIIIASSLWMPPQSFQLSWNQNDATPVEAQANVYRIYLDNLSASILTGVTCQLLNNQTECRAPLPIVSIGTHTIQLEAENEFGVGERSAILAFRYPLVPSAPTGLKIIR